MDDGAPYTAFDRIASGVRDNPKVVQFDYHYPCGCNCVPHTTTYTPTPCEPCERFLWRFLLALFPGWFISLLRALFVLSSFPLLNLTSGYPTSLLLPLLIVSSPNECELSRRFYKESKWLLRKLLTPVLAITWKVLE